MDTEVGCRYFLQAQWQTQEQEVSRAQYMAAEKAAGFYSKTGDRPATASFTGRGMNGRIEYPKLPDHGDPLLNEAQAQVDAIIRSLRLFKKKTGLPLTVQMASDVVEALLDSDFIGTIRLTLKEDDVVPNVGDYDDWFGQLNSREGSDK